MYKLHLLLFLLIVHVSVNAQSIEDRIKQRVKQKVENKVDNAIDTGFNKVEQGVGKTGKKIIQKKEQGTTKEKKSKKHNNNTGTNSDNETTGKDTIKPGESKAFSDFIPGANVLFADDFANEPEGDFPAKWNTNGSGRVVELSKMEGRWLEVIHGSVVHPVLSKPLPENCTIEFDLFLKTEGERNTPLIQFGLSPVKNILREDLFYLDKFYTTIWHYSDRNEKLIEYGFRDPVGTKNDFPILKYTNKVLRVSIAINKSRIRVYLDQTKLIDLPTALTPAMRNTFYLCNATVVPPSEVGMFVSNLRIASGEVDARSLLIKDLLEKGKTSTSDILFDVNSDVIKKESYAIVNQFGEALVSNPELKIKIIGHTDSDGAEVANLSLSKKRAAAVKNYITENFTVAGSRILTDGKGESQPAVPNTTADGKAKNRRVEFIKL